MEKFPKSDKGEKIRNIVGTASIAGLSALAILSAEKSPETKKEVNSPKEKIEWNRNELEANESIKKEVAVVLAKQWLQECIHVFNRSIEDFSKEYIHRKLTGQIEDYPEISTEQLGIMLNGYIECKKSNENELKNLKDVKNLQKSDNIENVVESNVNNIKQIISNYDIGRQWVLDNINNPEYLERLKKEEEKSDPDMSKSDLRKKTEMDKLIRTTGASDRNFKLSSDISKSYGPTNKSVGAFYNTLENKTHFPLDADSSVAVEYAIHEYAHKVTRANNFLSPRAIELFSNAFDSLSVVSNLSGVSSNDTVENVQYFSDPTEMYARKKVFDHDLEILGVKKYEEKFTMEHYLKVLNLQKEGKLSSGSNQFLYSVKPKMIIKIMNEIADVGDIKREGKGNGTYYNPGWDYGQNPEA